jgi:oligopeptide transport system permease protein
VAGYVLKRLLSVIPTLFIVVTLSFFLMRLAPGGPFDLERPLDPKVMENLRRIYELDRPLPEQYLTYLWHLAQGDLGPSFYWRDFTVNELFARALPVSMRLGSCAIALALLVGVSLGCLAALRQNRASDHAAMTLAAFGVTTPTFVIAPLLQLVFGLWLGWLPQGGWNDGAWRNSILPIATLALPQTAAIARLTRAAMLEALRAPSMRTLRAYGLPGRVILSHALRGAALPVVSWLGPAAAQLMTGSIVVETVFGLPGIGRYFVEGALNRDYTLVLGTVIVVSVLVLAFNLAADLIYGALDPRVRHE